MGLTCRLPPLTQKIEGMLDALSRQSREVEEDHRSDPALPSRLHQLVELLPLLRDAADDILVLDDQHKVVAGLDESPQLVALGLDALVLGRDPHVDRCSECHGFPLFVYKPFAFILAKRGAGI